jgi:uncharacterized protein (TIGR02996 family)
MIPEEDRFRQAIAAVPAEDLPRQAHADWLEEHGDSPRAEFIRRLVIREALSGEAERALRERFGEALRLSI